MSRKSLDIPQIAELSTPEKILFLEDLWDDIAASEEEVPVPESHMVELDRRDQRHSQQPGGLLSLEDLQGRIEKRK